MLKFEDATQLRLDRLFDVATIEEIEALIALYPEAMWRPLGNREKNYPAVNVGSDPGDALVERITNGQDALIERAMARAGFDAFGSPRQAVETLFGIPGGRLSNVKDTGRRDKLARDLSVTCRDSGDKKRPTIVVEDHGIGQHPEDFPKTLLSLNEGNKEMRHELIGAYGQGGASVFAYTPYSLFISRRDPDLLQANQRDEVGWTIVRFNELDENHKYGVYEFMVLPDGRGGYEIPRFNPADLPAGREGFVGCHFVATEYQIERYSDVVFHSHGSLWFMLNATLFDPIYPILIRDERQRAIKEDQKRALNGIVVSGNATRLIENKRKKVEYDNKFTMTLDAEGAALVRYFLIQDEGDAQRNWEVMENYIPRNLAVTITLNGQRQGTMRRDIFDKMGLMSIGRMLIVHVDCDGLSKRAKKELFSTTRDRIKDSPITKKLEQRIVHGLASDTQLRTLDRVRKEHALARQSEAEAKKIQEWLKDAINSLRAGLKQVFRKVISTDTEYQILGDQPLLDEVTEAPNPTGSPTEASQITEPPEIPTTLQVLNPTARIPVNGTGVVRLALNAPDEYVSPEPVAGTGRFTAQFTKGGALFEMTSYSALRGGVMRVTISANKGTPVGETGKVIFAVTRPDSLPLLAEAEVTTVDVPKARAKPAGTSTGQEQGPQVRPVDRQGWHELGLTDNVVTKVEYNPTDQTTTIYVFQEYPRLMNALQRKRVTPESLVRYQTKFVAAMALAAWLQHEEMKNLDSAPDQDARDAEIARATEVFLLTQFVTNDPSLE